MRWGGIDLPRVTNKRVIRHLFNSPVILYDGSVTSFTSEAKYWEIILEGVTAEWSFIEDMESSIDHVRSLILYDEQFETAFLVDFTTEYWMTDRNHSVWYRWSARFIAYGNHTKY